MRVTRLEIFGFKSFVDRFVLNFDENVIGIVGPNGCGKSNIVDALRWVLGETHARQLRGNVFDDLIFNGSQSRRPLGMAEVTITIRPSEGWSTNSLSRIETPGLDGAVYAALGETKPKAKDESAPPTDAWLSAEELNAQNDHVEEEKETPAVHFLDIPGLFDSSEIQLTRRLYRSGESEYFINRVPCRLRDMVEFYRLIGLGSRGLSIVAQGQISDIVNRKPLERRELIEEAAGIAGFRARIETAERKLDKTRDNLARIEDVMGEVEKQVKVLARQAKRARERADVKARLRDLELELFAIRAAQIAVRESDAKNRLAEFDGTEGNLLSKIALHEARYGESQAQLEEWEGKLGAVRVRRDALMGELARRQSERSELELEFARAEGRQKLFENNLRRVDDRKVAIGVEIERRRLEFEKHQSLQSQVNEKRAGAEVELKALVERGNSNVLSGFEPDEGGETLQDRIARLNAELAVLPELGVEIQGLESTVKRLRETHREESGSLNERRIRAASLESEIRSIENQLQALAEHVRKGAGLEDGDSESRASERVLLAAIRSPQELQRPLAAILGEKAKFLITQEPELLAKLFESKKQSQKQNQSQFGVIHQGVTAIPNALAADLGATRLIELLEIDNDVREVVEVILGEVVLVDSVSQGLEFIAHAPKSATAVTRDGEVVTHWGWYTTEGKGASFSFARVVEARREELRGIAAEMDLLTEQVRSTDAELQRETERLKTRTEERERLIASQKELARLLARLQELERQARNVFLQEERSAQARLRAVIEELASSERSMSFELRRIEELREERSGLDRESEMLAEQARELRRSQEELQGRIDSFDSDPENNAAGKEAELRKLELDIHELDGRRNSIRVEYANLSQELEEARREISEMERRRSDLRVVVERSAVEREMLLEDIRRFYGPEVELPDTAEMEAICERRGESFDSAIGSIQPEVLALRNRLEREGEVDPESIEQYETERVRLEEMSVQFEELEAASQTLKRTIDHLTEISRVRFLETFTDVARRFEDLVPRLFGGGSGQLQLVNPEEPLASGIEVVIRPPGKKIRSLELLSGGEKALTATAIIVAMFLHRPSPICVLDEVDAPLDDANLDRFLKMIGEIAETTQFLVITHNKQTMAAADRLIGITMQESGVSTALTVSLDEASVELEQLAASA